MGDNDLIAPRREIAQFTPYVPGRDMDTVKKMYGLKRVVKLASNENALGPSPKAVAALRAAAGRVNLYPDGFSTELRRALAVHMKVKPTQVTVGAGSDELIEILAKAYLTPADDIVVSDHAFIRYKMAGDLMGSKVITVPMRGMTHDLEAMAAAVTPRTKFVFIANPNNPTGTHNTKTELEEFLITLPARVVAVVDEAYFEFARAADDYPSALDFFKAGRNLVVLRTFSKAYGLAGVRLGLRRGAGIPHRNPGAGPAALQHFHPGPGRRGRRPVGRGPFEAQRRAGRPGEGQSSKGPGKNGVSLRAVPHQFFARSGVAPPRRGGL
jgi:histidinol-phosphate aminotransferase